MNNIEATMPKIATTLLILFNIFLLTKNRMIVNVIINAIKTNMNIINTAAILLAQSLSLSPCNTSHHLEKETVLVLVIAPTPYTVVFYSSKNGKSIDTKAITPNTIHNILIIKSFTFIYTYQIFILDNICVISSAWLLFYDGCMVSFLHL